MQQLCCCLLGHQLTIHQHDIFKTVSDACISLRPRNILLNSTMGRAHNLSGMINKKYLDAAERHITPLPTLMQDSNDFTPPITLRATTSRLVRFDSNKYLSLSLLKIKPCAA